MRQLIFRVLAGFIGLAFLGFLILGDRGKLTPRQIYGAGIIGIGLLLFACLGAGLGEQLIASAFGINPSQPPK
jgi:hypothetical protein